MAGKRSKQRKAQERRNEEAHRDAHHASWVEVLRDEIVAAGLDPEDRDAVLDWVVAQREEASSCDGAPARRSIDLMAGVLLAVDVETDRDVLLTTLNKAQLHLTTSYHAAAGWIEWVARRLAAGGHEPATALRLFDRGMLAVEPFFVAVEPGFSKGLAREAMEMVYGGAGESEDEEDCHVFLNQLGTSGLRLLWVAAIAVFVGVAGEASSLDVARQAAANWRVRALEDLDSLEALALAAERNRWDRRPVDYWIAREAARCLNMGAPGSRTDPMYLFLGSDLLRQEFSWRTGPELDDALAEAGIERCDGLEAVTARCHAWFVTASASAPLGSVTEASVLDLVTAGVPSGAEELTAVVVRAAIAGEPPPFDKNVKNAQDIFKLLVAVAAASVRIMAAERKRTLPKAMALMEESLPDHWIVLPATS